MPGLLGFSILTIVGGMVCVMIVASIWRRDYRRGVLGHSTVPAFMTVSLPEPEAMPCDVVAPAASSADTKIEIALLSGRRLTVSVSIDPNVLGRLLSVLEGR